MFKTETGGIAPLPLTPYYISSRVLNKVIYRRCLTEFGYGLHVKRKEKCFYIPKCINITNNSGNKDLLKVKILK